MAHNPQFEERLRAATQQHLAGQWDAAETAYADLLNEAPRHAHLLYLVGTLNLQRNRAGQALHLLRAAVELAPESLEAWANLGAAHFRLCEFAAARVALERAHALDPGHLEVQASLAALHVNESDPERALGFARAVLAAQPNNPVARWNAALALLELGQWEEGWQHYEAGFEVGDRQRRNYPALGALPEWAGEPGRRVLVYGEMGLGDEILFASCLSDLQRVAAQITFDCHPRLEALFRRSFPGLRVLGTRKTEGPVWADSPPVDAIAAIGSLPRYFRRSDSAFPRQPRYLQADAARVEHYRRRLAALPGPGPRIAVAWHGGTAATRSELRSIPLRQWAPILASSAAFVSVQYTDGAAGEAAQFGIPHWPEAIDDLDEQAALLSACDLLISVCQTAVHMAGALGVPTWCLTPAKPAWRYGLHGAHMPWYASVRLLRQSAQAGALPGDAAWAGVIADAAAQLRGAFPRTPPLHERNLGAQG